MEQQLGVIAQGPLAIVHNCIKCVQAAGILNRVFVVVFVDVYSSGLELLQCNSSEPELLQCNSSGLELLKCNSL
eukprot:13154104-Heterocapsa_arctica.AAC.1